MKDLHSNVAALTMIGAAALDADNTPPAIDMQGYDAAEVLLAIGVGGISFNGTNKIEFKLTHSDDDVSYEAVTLGDMLGLDTVGDDGIVKALKAAHPEAATYRFGYVGGRRFLKLLADFSGTHGSGTPIAAIALLGHPQIAPVANAA